MSLVELKDEAIAAGLRMAQSIDPGDEDFEEKSRALVNCVNAACNAAAQVNQDTWAPNHEKGVQQHG